MTSTNGNLKPMAKFETEELSKYRLGPLTIHGFDMGIIYNWSKIKTKNPHLQNNCNKNLNMIKYFR